MVTYTGHMGIQSKENLDELYLQYSLIQQSQLPLVTTLLKSIDQILVYCFNHMQVDQWLLKAN